MKVSFVMSHLSTTGTQFGVALEIRDLSLLIGFVEQFECNLGDYLVCTLSSEGTRIYVHHKDVSIELDFLHVLLSMCCGGFCPYCIYRIGRNWCSIPKKYMRWSQCMETCPTWWFTQKCSVWTCILHTSVQYFNSRTVRANYSSAIIMSGPYRRFCK